MFPHAVTGLFLVDDHSPPRGGAHGIVLTFRCQPCRAVLSFLVRRDEPKTEEYVNIFYNCEDDPAAGNAAQPFEDYEKHRILFDQTEDFLVSADFSLALRESRSVERLFSITFSLTPPPPAPNLSQRPDASRSMKTPRAARGKSRALHVEKHARRAGRDH